MPSQCLAPRVHLRRLELMKHVASLENGLGDEASFRLEVTIGFQDPDKAALIYVLEHVRG